MSSTTLECRACHYPVAPGAALLVTPRTGNPPPAPFVVHRVQLVAGCIRAAGRSSDATIALYDPEAADLFDRANADGGPTAHARADRDAVEVKRVFARNTAISARDARYEREGDDGI